MAAGRWEAEASAVGAAIKAAFADPGAELPANPYRAEESEPAKTEERIEEENRQAWRALDAYFGERQGEIFR